LLNEVNTGGAVVKVRIPRVSPTADLGHVADARDSQFAQIQLVDNDRVGLHEVFEPACGDIPRPRHRRARLQTDDHDAFLGTVPPGPLTEAGDVLLRGRDAGRREHSIKPGFRHLHRGLEMRHAFGLHPDVRAAHPDEIGRRAFESHEQAELDRRENDAEDDAGQGDDQPNAVVEEVAERE
jgi:hypothetical protein